VSEGSTNLRAAVFCCHDLDVGPMTLKMDRNIDILKTYLHAIVARSSHSTLIASINTNIALKVKGQGQMSPTSNHL